MTTAPGRGKSEMGRRLGNSAAAIGVVAASLVLGSPDAGGVAGFGDVAPGGFYTPAVQWMVDEEITAGLTETCFAPGATVTRGQVAAFMWRMEGEPAPGPDHGFGDVVQGWQQSPVSWMVDRGITFGYTATRFGPERALTRHRARSASS